MTTVSPSPISTLDLPRTPSAGLLTAALAGLLGTAGACGGGTASPDARATADAATADAALPDAGTPDASPDAGSKIISETEVTKTFAELTADCTARGGYTQVTAACAGVNMCAGFSYGDWDPGVLTEHSCAGVNGCNGISCIVLPPDGGKTGEQILAAELPETGARSCVNCHAEWTEAGVDATKFKVWVQPGSGRTLANWLDRTAAAQARIVAFGKHGELDDGTAFAHMSAYYQIYSRAEIERVVEYVRALPQDKLILSTIKYAD